MKQAGLDHAKIHVCLGSKDASTQTEPLETSTKDITSHNDNMIGSLFDNENIALSNFYIKEEPDTSFELEKAMMNHGVMEDEIIPSWQVLGIPGNTNHMIFTQQPPLVLHETFNNGQVTESLLEFQKTKAVEDDGTRDNVGKEDLVEEKGKESTVASTYKPKKNADSVNKLAGKQMDPIVTDTPKNNAENQSNSGSLLRSGGKKTERVSKTSLASMWKQAKQEMNEENDKPAKRRGRPKKQNTSEVPSRVKRKYVRHKPISEPKPSNTHKKCKVQNKEVNKGAQHSDDSEDNEEMDVDDLKNDDEKEDETTQRKTRINYVGGVYIDIFNLSQYYTFVKELSKKGEDGYRCDLCNRTLIGPEEDKTRIERHVVTHSEEMRTHKCETCGKKFSHEYNLKKHMLSHSEIRPFKCPVCDYAANRKDHVRRHIKQWHSIGLDQYADRDGKPVTLEELGYGNLKIRVKPNEQGLYTCHGCDATFSERRYLSRHVERIHRAKSGQGIPAFVTVNCLCYKMRFGAHILAL